MLRVAIRSSHSRLSSRLTLAKEGLCATTDAAAARAAVTAAVSTAAVFTAAAAVSAASSAPAARRTNTTACSESPSSYRTSYVPSPLSFTIEPPYHLPLPPNRASTFSPTLNAPATAGAQMNSALTAGSESPSS